MAYLGAAGVAVTGGIALIAGLVVAGSVVGGVKIYKTVQGRYLKDAEEANSIQAALEILEQLAQATEDRAGRVQALMKKLHEHLVKLKRVSAPFKKDLEQRFDWDEPLLGDGAFKNMDWPQFDLEQLADAIRRVGLGPDEPSSPRASL